MMQSVKTGKSFHPIEPLEGPGDASQSMRWEGEAGGQRAETVTRREVEKRTEQNSLSKHSVEKNRGKWGGSEKHRVKGRLFGVFFRDGMSGEKSTDRKDEFEGMHIQLPRFYCAKRHDCLQRKRSLVFL